jgi:opacity protein-like surface antigen
MKTQSNRTKIPLILVAACLVSASSTTAETIDIYQDVHSNPSDNTKIAGSFYVNGGAGVAILQNIEYRGEVAQLNVGPRFDVSVGYNLTQCLAVEVQSGFAYNTWSKVDGKSLAPFRESVDIWSVPVTANGIYQHSFSDHLQVYGGLGAGVLVSTLDESVPGGSVHPTDCEFAYQAMFGIKYLFNDHLECGLGYDFLGSLDHHWGENGSSVTTTPTYMHSILLSLTLRF